MIELKEIKKKFGNQIALQNVNLSVSKGEIFGIIGRSGAGKSTLLRCINRLDSPDMGQILLEKEDITHLSGKCLRNARQKTSMIFQHFNLLNTLSAYENIALPMHLQGIKKSAIKHKINELLKLVELQDKENAYPSELSGGQKQRVAIARALSTSPKILLCDEATSALDPETTDAILRLLQKINQALGLTIVLITHEMEVVRRICHRLALMDRGKIIEQSSISEVFNTKDSLARKLLYAQLSPELPFCLQKKISPNENNHPIFKIIFDGHEATTPLISQMSRNLLLDINILMANIDRYNDLTCGVLIASTHASPSELNVFLEHCQQHNITVEILGYVNETAL